MRVAHCVSDILIFFCIIHVNVTKALKMWNMADNTLIVFTSDNGGQNFKGGSNYPLRGGKVQLSPTT